jgi:hypothetical protein
VWKERGVEMKFDAKNAVDGFFFYDGSRDGFRKYEYELPAGLSFTDTVEVVKKKCGNPERIWEGVDGAPTQLDYEASGMYLYFDARNFAAGTATLCQLSYFIVSVRRTASCVAW